MKKQKKVALTLHKPTWKSQPNGAELEHELTVKMLMSDEEREEVEDLFRHYWDHNCILIGEVKPVQMGLGDTSPIDEGGD